ncbi:unnamed protein product [Microthlaspi erraticum]|uniref:FBD domain-containing protein n=1 Tax=Microthlaspi erraticum TaxID=1685480 RepID=A0A6D2I7M2_9BRAS|nr:unnamed protein product [Microthlaspi erraticum]
MVMISDLSDDLLIKVLSFLTTKVAVSTSILSKQWRFLWRWLPKLEYNEYDDLTGGPMCSWWGSMRYEECFDKNLPLHRAPVIESLRLRFYYDRFGQPETIKRWVGIAVSRFVRELSIVYLDGKTHNFISLPSSLYSCSSLMTLKLEWKSILVDVPRIVCLPSLKTLQLRFVTYLDDSLGLLLSQCPVLEDLCIAVYRSDSNNERAIVVNVPSLQRLSLEIDSDCSSDGYVIVTPCLKYLKIEDYRDYPSYLIEPMPKLEEADIDVVQDIDKILESITSVRRLSLRPWFNSAEEYEYRAGIVFTRLEHLELGIHSNDWSKLLIWLLGSSPKLQGLYLYVEWWSLDSDPLDWKNKQSSIPELVLTSLETFELKGMGTQEERDFLTILFKHASCLKSTSITGHDATQFGV